MKVSGPSIQTSCPRRLFRRPRGLQCAGSSPQPRQTPAGPVQSQRSRISRCAGTPFAALDELRARERELRFPRHAVSCIDEYGYHVLRLRAQGATIGDCHRALREEHGLRAGRSTVSRWLRKHVNGQA